MTIAQKPSLVVHCDWGKDEHKRWMAKATLHDDVYRAHGPEQVGRLDDLILRIQNQRCPYISALIGFDFPIGVPSGYAAHAGISDFSAFLKVLGNGKWKDFFELCRHKEEISIFRPFYPYNFTPKGSKSPHHLVQSLSLSTLTDLLRTCDGPHAQRQAAGALFWTLGPKAPGRGALFGWQHVLQPALREGEIQLWPFHGCLDSLLKPGSTVVAETYPSQYYESIFGQLNGSKTKQDVRTEAGPAIEKWAAKRSEHLQLDSSLRSEIQAGFHHGDDAFDAAIGLFGMIDAIQNYSPALEPEDETIRNIEGWIFGQPAR